MKILLLIAAAALFLCSCDLTEQRYYEIMQLDYAEEQSELLTVFEYRNGMLERSMEAAKLDRYYEKKKTISYNVTITDFFPDGRVKMTLVADTLMVDEMKNSYTGLGGVVITRDEGILKTEHLVWNQNTNEIYTPGEATLIRGENVMRGIELKSDTEFTKIELRRVTAEGRLDEEDIDW